MSLPVLINRFKNYLPGLFIFAMVVSLIPLKPLKAEVVSLSGRQFNSYIQRNEAVFVIFFLTCDAGSHYVSKYNEMVKGIRGPKFVAVSYKDRNDINISFPSGGILAMYFVQNGKVVSQSDSYFGKNRIIRFIYSNLQKYKVTSNMSRPAAERIKPGSESGANLSKGKLAHYRFENSFKSEGSGPELEYGKTVRFKDGAVYLDGIYQGFRNGSDLLVNFPGRTMDLPFTYMLDFNLENLEGSEETARFFCFGKRRICLGLHEDKLLIDFDIVREVNGKYIASEWMYVIDRANIQFQKWNSIIIGVDASKNRMAVMLNGKRLDDYYLNPEISELAKKDTNHQGVYFQHLGAGKIFHGSADNLIVYNRKLTGAEMQRLYNSYSRHKHGGTNIANVDENNTNDNSDEEDNVKPDIDRSRLNSELLTAAYKGDLSGVKTAVRNGANVNTRAKQGWTALLYSAYFGHTAIIKYLLDNYADISLEVDGWSARDMAEYKSHSDIVSLLDQHYRKDRNYTSFELFPPKHRGGPALSKP